jgi:hypothetical protein
MVTLNTESSSSDGQNKTFTSVSTNIIIKVGANPVGAITSLSINENRPIAMIDEVGTDGHIDSVPKSATNITGDCKRTRFDNLRIAAAFSRGFIHVASQRVPFDIHIIDTFAGSDPGSMLTTVIKSVWISKINYTYSASDFIIVEDMSWEAERIYSTIGSGNAVTTVAGGRNLILPGTPNEFERQTDRGGRIGSLDASGLLLEIGLV